MTTKTGGRDLAIARAFTLGKSMNQSINGDVAALALIERTNITGVLRLALALELRASVELLSSNDRAAIVYIRVTTREQRLAKVTATYVLRFDGLSVLSGTAFSDDGAVRGFTNNRAGDAFNGLSDFRDAVRILAGQGGEYLTERGQAILAESAGASC